MYGKRSEKPVHRVTVSIPEHYLNASPQEQVTTSQVAYDNVREFERKYLGIGLEGSN